MEAENGCDRIFAEDYFNTNLNTALIVIGNTLPLFPG